MADDHFPFGPLAAAHDTARLVAAIWPAGGTDRYVPGAVEWVRRWGPRTNGVTARPCTCVAGRCETCG